MVNITSVRPWSAAMLASLLAAACIATEVDAPAERDAASERGAGGASLPISADAIDAAPAPSNGREAPPSRRCPGCGFVESVRAKDEVHGRIAPEIVKIDAGRPASADAALDRPEHVVTVRMRDGSTASFETRSPRSWRLGQRVNVIVPAHVADR
jgi:hypothetical protein